MRIRFIQSFPKNNVRSDVSELSQNQGKSNDTNISDYASKKEEKGAEEAVDAVKDLISGVSRQAGTMAKETYKAYKKIKKSTPEAAESTPNPQSASPIPTPEPTPPHGFMPKPTL